MDRDLPVKNKVGDVYLLGVNKRGCKLLDMYCLKCNVYGIHLQLHVNLPFGTRITYIAAGDYTRNDTLGVPLCLFGENRHGPCSLRECRFGLSS